MELCNEIQDLKTNEFHNIFNPCVRKWQNKMNRFSLGILLFLCKQRNKEGMITDLANLTLYFLRGFQKVVTNCANWDCGMNCLQKPRKISLQLGTLTPCINIKANIDPRSVMEMFLLWMVLSGSLGRALLSRWELSCYPKWQLADANLYWSLQHQSSGEDETNYGDFRRVVGKRAWQGHSWAVMFIF